MNSIFIDAILPSTLWPWVRLLH